MTAGRAEPSRTSTETHKDNINWLAKQLAPFVPLPSHACPSISLSFGFKSLQEPYTILQATVLQGLQHAGLAFFFFPSLQKKCEMQQNKPSISHKYIKQSSPSQRTGCLLPQV